MSDSKVDVYKNDNGTFSINPEKCKGTIEVTRYFTKDLKEWDSEINWTFRDAIIKGNKDKPIFEQDNVIFPDFWSDNAVNIVSSKYFRGKLGTEEREYSLKDLITRVVDTIAGWGLNQGYYNGESLEIFKDELKWLLVNQYFSFNSPVWFNVGNEKFAQAGGCFLNSVNDNMESILDLVKKEGLIFKGGSGSGVNLSSLRSSKEYVKGGGKASGPLSWMKIYDVTAASIRSGGKTRRAAKMVMLNCDHPDIVDFINCKIKEEEKANALIKQGYDGSFNGEAYESVFFQNSNHSIRVTDKFMKAARDNKEWNTLEITTGNVSETHKAKDILMRAAKAAWKCGDPGIIFHDNTNKWNTCSNSFEIKNVNPCIQGSMMIKTSDGDKKIEDLVAKEVEIINKDGDKVRSDITYTGEKELVSINFSHQQNKSPLLFTPDHDFMLNDGSSCKAKDLAHKRIMPFYKIKDVSDNDDKLLLAGFIQGDENTGRLNSKAHKGLEVNIGKKDLEMLEYIPDGELNGHKVYSRYSLNIAKHFRLSAEQLPYRNIPSWVFAINVSDKDVASFLCGLYTANGCVIKKARVGFKTTCKDLADNLIKLLHLRFNISAYLTTNKPTKVKFDNGEYLCKESYDVNISRFSDILSFASNISFVQKYKQIRLEELIVSRGYYVASVKKVEGLHKVYDFTEPLTHWGVIEGVITHNCGEFSFIDDSSCNLASLNLIKFDEHQMIGKTFDNIGFEKAISHIILAQDILVDNSCYPTKEIAENSSLYRPLGLGYSNAGSFLLRRAIPYDSDKGCNLIAYITSLMTSYAYKTSANLAKYCGQFKMFDDNKTSFYEIMNQHQKYCDCLPYFDGNNDAHFSWVDTNVRIGESGTRNAQVTLLAPCGTIGFMMDCDTTGIEPSIALTTYKKLSGGGDIEIPNKSVQIALDKLGYNSLDDVKEEHLAIFDCALNRNGRSISAIGHMKMMNAVQPFLSGAISKTINIPESSTVEDIYNIYFKAWEMGLKSITVYRNNSKKIQPLSNKKAGETKETIVTKEIKITNKSIRKRLPDERKAITHKFNVAGHEGYITIGLFPDGSPGELFIIMSKEGSTVSGLMDGFATMTSLGLQYGVPLEDIVKKFSHMRFEPAGMTRNKDIPFAKSIYDYIFRYIGKTFVDKSDSLSYNSIQVMEEKEDDNSVEIDVSQEDSPPCPECGRIMVRAGACHSCTTCGATSGCS